MQLRAWRLVVRFPVRVALDWTSRLRDMLLGSSRTLQTQMVISFLQFGSSMLTSQSACTYYGYGEYDLSCYNTYLANNTIYTDLTVGNPANRQWNWILCNEPLNFWQDGAPRSRDTIVSRLVTAEYWTRQCGLFFPYDNGYTYGMNISADINVNQVNKWSEGWLLEDTTRLTWTNGQFDPWKSASVSSQFRPGGPLASTAQHPVNIVPDGVHCFDLILQNGINNAGVQAVIDIETKQIVECKCLL